MAKHRKWQEIDDEIIRMHYPELGSDVASLLSEPRERHNIQRRAKDLGIKCLKPRKPFFLKRR